MLQNPLRGVELLAGVARALELSRDSRKPTEWRKDAADHLASLTRRQHQIMEMVLAGHPSKNIAADLGISQRTVTPSDSQHAGARWPAGLRCIWCPSRSRSTAIPVYSNNASQTRPRYGHRRATHCFPSRKEAKKFARSKMTEADHIAAGTLNPHLPNTVIAQKGGSDPRGGEAI